MWAPLVALVCVAGAAAVFADARRHLPQWAAQAWALATLFAAPLAVPIYLLVRPSRTTSWGFAEIASITMVFAVSIPLLSVLAIQGMRAWSPLLLVSALAVLQDAFFAAAGYYVVRIKYHLPLSSIGLTAGAWGRRFWQGGVASIAAVVGNSLGQNATIYAVALWKGMSQPAAQNYVSQVEVRVPLYHLLSSLHQLPQMILLGLTVGVIVPVGEEIFFRGLTLGALRRRLNRHLAVLVSAVFFAAAHVFWVELLPIAFLGIVLGYLYELTGSLVPGMIAHGVNNIIALVILYQTPAGS
jgi:membrane protease YdiL (CAAX protease family)